MSFLLPIDIHRDRPVYQQIADGVIDAIRRGQLQSDHRVPGSRSLAASLGVHRNTVLAAYDDLIAQGWLQARAGSGTFVSGALAMPVEASARKGIAQTLAYRLPRGEKHKPTGHAPARLSLEGGLPDLRLAPASDIARAYRRALRKPAALGYGDPRGHERLRAALSQLLNAERGLATCPGDLLITQGSQMALYLAAGALTTPGDVVVVEQLGYRPAWHCFQRAGARVLAVPVDDEGLDVEALARLVAHTPIRAVYLTPHHQYPTTVVLSASRRSKLLALAKKHRFALIEDDYDNEVHYRGRPVPPLASNDVHGSVIYIGTLSKTLAPGLRIGYVVAPARLLRRLAADRVNIDRQGNSGIEAAIAELLEDGLVQRHARKMRRHYQLRRDTLVSLLQEELADVIDFAVPDGGLAIWARAKGVRVERWAQNARERGLAFQTARHFAFDGKTRRAIRLGYASSTPAELGRAVRLMRTSLPCQ